MTKTYSFSTFTRRLPVFLAIIAVAICLCFASETKVYAASAIQTRADAQTGELTRYAEYYGWNVAVKQYKTTGNEIRKTVKVSGTKGIFNFKQITKKANSRFATTWYSNSKKYSLTGIKTSLKKYSSSSDIREMLEDDSGIKADALEKNATKNGWSVARSTSYKKGTAYTKLTFKNSKYSFTAKVSSYRKNGKVINKYWRQDNTSSKKDILSWLTKYKA